ncbi:hypothetical protein K0M31_000003 [Melipona bicolor]|uniref:Uncharacterized protein n=1 Tax=Melipona bicolor TaxID=60889 RepID=A0AA40GCW3_9HYME|nr:hypothetical protein K0M31_000003 [Melipona bicolor]
MKDEKEESWLMRLPDACYCNYYPLGWSDITPILAGFRTLLCLTSESGRTSTLGAQPLAACASQCLELVVEEP